MTAANARAVPAAIGFYLRVTRNGDIAARASYEGDGSIFVGALTRAAANACRQFAAGGCNVAAFDGDVRDTLSASAADPRAVYAASGVQRVVSILVGNGQAAFVILPHAGGMLAALDRIAAIQFDGHVAFSLGGDGSVSRNHRSRVLVYTCFGTAHINIHIGDGDLGGLVFIRLDGDGILGGGRFAVRLLDDGFGGLMLPRYAVLLGDVLAALLGLHGDAALRQVIYLRQGRQRDRQDQHQRHCQSQKLLHHIHFPPSHPPPQGRRSSLITLIQK